MHLIAEADEGDGYAQLIGRELHRYEEDESEEGDPLNPGLEEALAGFERRVVDKLPDLPEETPEYRMGPHGRDYTWMRWVAVFILVCGIGLLVFMKRDRTATPETVVAADDDIAPGHNQATLTLSDGRTIALDSAQQKIVIADDQLTYENGETIAAEGADIPEEVYHTITTPEGGQYQVVLPDGTTVWLNAQSSLVYPRRFSATHRVVSITGEAFFDVAKGGAGDKSTPFTVRTPAQEVSVLGTQFNVNAYREVEQTTLVSGAVRVKAGAAAKSVTLAPGEQSTWADGALGKKEVDVEAVIAWSKGYFFFDGDLKSIMEQVSRWYGVEVAYDEGVDTRQELMGKISRDRTLKELIRVLEAAGNQLSFRLDGRRLTVMR